MMTIATATHVWSGLDATGTAARRHVPYRLPMRLLEVTVQLFRNFVEPQTVAIEDDVTCLVGKNESGKTTLLKALHRLNPANGTDRHFDLTTEYPRWRLASDRRTNKAIAEVRPVTGRFELDDADLDALGSVLGTRPPNGTQCVASRDYDNALSLTLTVPVASRVGAAAEAADVAPEDLATLMAETDIQQVAALARQQAKELKPEPDTLLRSKALTAFVSALNKLAVFDENGELDDETYALLESRLPSFFYFAEYQNLPGECDLHELASNIAAGTELSASDETVVALLAYAGNEPKDFLDEDYDSRKAELQSTSGDLSRRAFEYWRQNTDLTVIFDTDMVKVGQHPGGGPIMNRYLKIELRDARHGDVETNFATRSSGFQWFFSFFAAFSAYQESDTPVLVLLDEPGTRLHGEAQKDFVRFIREELGAAQQTLYTTHSQHMVDPTRYEKLRAVHDSATREDHAKGVIVAPIDLSSDPDTVLPVESALGYSISQHLFIGSGHHLAVEGSSDFVYLQRMTELFLERGTQDGLDPRLAIIPVGSAGNMPAFVALLGRRLMVSALIDGNRTDAKAAKVLAAANANGVPESAVVTCADAASDLPRNADIEDLFAAEDYLRLYNWAFGSALTVDQLPPTQEPLLRRLQQAVGDFDHARPAHALTRQREEFFSTVTTETTDRFRSLFALLNATLVDT